MQPSYMYIYTYARLCMYLKVYHGFDGFHGEIHAELPSFHIPWICHPLTLDFSTWGFAGHQRFGEPSEGLPDQGPSGAECVFLRPAGSPGGHKNGAFEKRRTGGLKYSDLQKNM